MKPKWLELGHEKAPLEVTRGEKFSAVNFFDSELTRTRGRRETRGLEHCMRRHGEQLTTACVASLLGAGLVTQAEVDRRRAAAGRLVKL